MEFRVLLTLLQTIFEDKEFVTANVYTKVYGTSWLLEKMPSTEQQGPTNRVPTLKMASKDLDRLFKMNLLSRRRTKRKVNTSSNKICNRGFNYVYKISAQGRSYIAFLKDPERIRKNELRRVRGFEDMMMNAYLQKIVGSELEPEEVAAIYQSLFPRNETSIERRFPIRANASIVQLVSRLLNDNRKYKRELEKYKRT